MISGITANPIEGLFLCEAPGFHVLKGIFESMQLFGVLSQSGAQTRFGPASATQLAPWGVSRS